MHHDRGLDDLVFLWWGFFSVSRGENLFLLAMLFIYSFQWTTYWWLSVSASSAALREISSARRASPEAADTFLAINSTASGSKDTKFSSLWMKANNKSITKAFLSWIYLEEIIVWSCFTLYGWKVKRVKPIRDETRFIKSLSGKSMVLAMARTVSWAFGRFGHSKMLQRAEMWVIAFTSPNNEKMNLLVKDILLSSPK